MSALWELYVLVCPNGFLICKSGKVIRIPSAKCQRLFKIEIEVAPDDL